MQYKQQINLLETINEVVATSAGGLSVKGREKEVAGIKGSNMGLRADNVQGTWKTRNADAQAERGKAIRNMASPPGGPRAEPVYIPKPSYGPGVESPQPPGVPEIQPPPQPPHGPGPPFGPGVEPPQLPKVPGDPYHSNNPLHIPNNFSLRPSQNRFGGMNTSVLGNMHHRSLERPGEENRYGNEYHDPLKKLGVDVLGNTTWRSLPPDKFDPNNPLDPIHFPQDPKQPSQPTSPLEPDSTDPDDVDIDTDPEKVDPNENPYPPEFPWGRPTLTPFIVPPPLDPIYPWPRPDAPITIPQKPKYTRPRTPFNPYFIPPWFINPGWRPTRAPWKPGRRPGINPFRRPVPRK